MCRTRVLLEFLKTENYDNQTPPGKVEIGNLRNRGKRNLSK